MILNMNYEKMHEVKQQIQEGNTRIRQFMENKKKNAQDEDLHEKLKQRNEIEEFEQEAEELERLEMDLLHKL